MSKSKTYRRTLPRLLEEARERGALPIRLLDEILERRHALDRELAPILRGLGQLPIVDDRPGQSEERVGPLRLLTPAAEVRLSKRIEFTRRRLERTIALSDLSEDSKAFLYKRIDVPAESRSAVRRGGDREKPTEADVRARWEEHLRQRNELVEANLALVDRIAARYRTYGIPHGDLVQHGNLGLIRAADKFDWRKNVRFRTYAEWWIRQAIERATDTDRDVIHVPRPMRQLISKAQHRHRRSGVDRPLDAERMAELTGADLDAARTALSIKTGVVSLDRASNDEDGTPMRNDLEGPDLSERNRREQIEHVRNRVRGLIETLPERERKVLSLRYGLGGDEPRTLEEVGAILNISRERVRQLQMRALEQLREKSEEMEDTYL